MVATNHSAVQVRVNEGVLWVAGEAYPLRNISHVGQRRLEVDKRAAWKKFALRTLIWLTFGSFVIAGAGTVGVFVWLAVEALLVWRLVTALGKPTLYGLVLNTSGTQRDAVWSTDAGEIDHLVIEITKAIGHPDIAQVTYNVQHAVQGDLIQQYGAGSVGKAQHSGSGDIVAGGKDIPAPESMTPAIDELLREIQKLRPHLDEHDRAEVDASVEEISANPSEERFRKLLRQIAGIATLVGETGAPVILAIRALLGTS